MNIRLGNQTNPSPSGPGADRPRSPVTPPSPRRRWLPLVGVAATVLVLRALDASHTMTRAYSYSTFLSQVQANHIKTATINQSGAVAGTLTNGTAYSTQLPTALPDAQLPGLLKAHHVVITALGSQTGIGTVILSLLPLLLLVGVIVWLGRRGTQHATRGIMGIGASKAKVYDEERPSTRFSDVAGYEGPRWHSPIPGSSNVRRSPPSRDLRGASRCQ
jgi:cell division protease FtsH